MLTSLPHRRLAASIAALSLGLHGCGGGLAEPATPAVASQLRLEGCVVDTSYVPYEGVPVRVLAPDGRTLAQATSGRRGEFIVELPAGAPATLAVDRPDGDSLATPALDRDSVMDSCLVARQ